MPDAPATAAAAMPTRARAVASVPENAIDLLRPAARSMHRILQVARIIADLASGAESLGPHATEADGYRRSRQATAPRIP